MKNRRKKLAVIIGATMFAMMMAFSITTSMNGTDFSLSGLEVLASGTSEPECDYGSCYVNVYQQGGNVCFICTTQTSQNKCCESTGCGSAVCWGGGD